MVSLYMQVFAEKMGLETGWNCHISLTPNGEGGAPSSPGQGSLHDDAHHGNYYDIMHSDHGNYYDIMHGDPHHGNYYDIVTATLHT